MKKLIKEITHEDGKVSGANGTSDVRFYNTMVNAPGVEFGPIGDGAHSNSEWVSLDSLNSYYHILKQFLLSIE